MPALALTDARQRITLGYTPAMRCSSARALTAICLLAVSSGCASVDSGSESSSAASSSLSAALDSARSPAHPPIVSDRFLLESPEQQIVGKLQVIEAHHEDTFVDIARAYNLGFDELVDANPSVDPWLPGAGTRIVLPTRYVLPKAPRDGIVINLASKRLFYYLPPDADGARAVITFPLGIGQSGWQTPEGSTTVTSKAQNPVWYVPASIRREYAEEGNPLPAKVLPGPDNPLGKHVLILGMPSYLLHGTNRPAGVGMRVSHGCVRLFPENIEFLYREAPVGVPVHIVNQPWLLAWEQGQLFLEAHQPLLDDERDWSAIFPGLLQAALRNAPNGRARAEQEKWSVILANSWGIPLPVLDKQPDGDAIIASVMRVNNLVTVPAIDGEMLARDEGENAL